MTSETDDAAEPREERTTIRSGREFERAYRLDASEAGDRSSTST